MLRSMPHTLQAAALCMPHTLQAAALFTLEAAAALCMPHTLQAAALCMSEAAAMLLQLLKTRAFSGNYMATFQIGCHRPLLPSLQLQAPVLPRWTTVTIRPISLRDNTILKLFSSSSTGCSCLQAGNAFATWRVRVLLSFAWLTSLHAQFLTVCFAGRIYFFNNQTGVSQWNPPIA